MRDIILDDNEKIIVTTQIGNNFYLCEAYNFAARIYEEILKINVERVKYDKILYQLIQSDIKSKNLEMADQHFQNFRQFHNLLTEYRSRGIVIY
jgi:outer membrane protein assembly factor BamD (BamD/ComL family)